MRLGYSLGLHVSNWAPTTPFRSLPSRRRFELSRNPKNRALEKNKFTEKISFCHDAWMYFSLQGSQVWPRCYQKCLRLSDANWLITPALITRSRRAKTKLPHWKSCGLGQTTCGGKPRSFVTGPFSLSARFARTWRSAPSQPRTCKGHWSNLYGSGHVLLWRTLSTQVYARAALRVWSAYRPLRSFVSSSTRPRLATLLAPKVFALNF